MLLSLAYLYADIICMCSLPIFNVIFLIIYSKSFLGKYKKRQRYLNISEYNKKGLIFYIFYRYTKVYIKFYYADSTPGYKAFYLSGRSCTEFSISGRFLIYGIQKFS